MRKYYIAITVIIILSFGAAALQALLGQAPARDIQRREDLTAISNAISSYAQLNKHLPNSLADVTVDSRNDKSVDTSPYTYNKTTNSRYELCTTFETKQGHSTNYATSDTYVSETIYVGNHIAGYQCFKAEPYSLKSYPNGLSK